MALYIGSTKISDVNITNTANAVLDTVTLLPGGGDCHDISGIPLVSGTINMTTSDASSHLFCGWFSNITEINITAGSATNSKYVSRASLYNAKFPSLANITYSGMTGCQYNGTNWADCLRQCNGIKTIDFGGINTPATITRFFYNVTKESYDKNHTMYIKGLDWTNTTTFTNCFRPSTAYSGWANDNWDLDVEWNGTINATTVSLAGTYSYPFTHRSLLELFNALSTNGGTLTVGTENLAKMTSAEIAIATGKGWTVS